MAMLERILKVENYSSINEFVAALHDYGIRGWGLQDLEVKATRFNENVSLITATFSKKVFADGLDF